MTRYGQALQLYSDYVCTRPHSRFTRIDSERLENSEWALAAVLWANKYMNEAGGLNQDGVNEYVLHVGFAI